MSDKTSHHQPTEDAAQLPDESLENVAGGITSAGGDTTGGCTDPGVQQPTGIFGTPFVIQIGTQTGTQI